MGVSRQIGAELKAHPHRRPNRPSCRFHPANLPTTSRILGKSFTHDRMPSGTPPAHSGAARVAGSRPSVDWPTPSSGSQHRRPPSQMTASVLQKGGRDSLHSSSRSFLCCSWSVPTYGGPHRNDGSSGSSRRLVPVRRQSHCTPRYVCSHAIQVATVDAMRLQNAHQVAQGAGTPTRLADLFGYACPRGRWGLRQLHRVRFACRLLQQKVDRQGRRYETRQQATWRSTRLPPVIAH